MLIRYLPLTVPLLAATGLLADGVGVSGAVLSHDGRPIEHARVAVGALEVWTDAAGRFAVGGCPSPCRLEISHPRYLRRVVEVAEAAELAITLQPKRGVYEEIMVTASRGAEGAIPVSLTARSVDPSAAPAAPATLAEVVGGVPGVAQNGQGGIFQVFSIRGVSRHRVLTLLAGAPLTSERRAGVSGSFLDPLLMGSVEILRGPASTYYGSGALGGVAQILPLKLSGWRLAGGYGESGDESHGMLGWGDGEWSLGVAHRRRGNARASDGSELNSHFDQVSAVVSGRFRLGGHTAELVAVPAFARDIGKSNTDFPTRTTNYPEERHLLVKLGVSSPAGWELSVWAHPHDLLTATTSSDERALVDNRTFDLGTSWQREWSRGEVTGLYGVDYFGRRGVEAVETVRDLATGSEARTTTLDGAEQDELAAFGSARWSWGEALLTAGGRLTWQRQANRGGPSSDDNAVTAFVGLVRPLAGQFELTANLGTGLRFPVLSERFFTGVTGRGEVVGNPDLEPESSLNADLGFRRFGQKGLVAVQLFRQEVADYIERIELAADVLTFVNLVSGEIYGVEVEGSYAPSRRWDLSFSGHRIEGEDTSGNALADIPADQLELGVAFEEGPWRLKARWRLLGGKTVVGAGEKPIPGAELLAAALSYRLKSGLAVTLRGENLLDETYFSSADSKVPLSPGRSWGVGFSWQPAA